MAQAAESSQKVALAGAEALKNLWPGEHGGFPLELLECEKLT
jgi:hypothetical protein